MTAKIVAIGDEILIGETLDTNTHYIAQQFTQLGITVQSIQTIADNAEEITNQLINLQEDILIFTGGLGPTKDDITKKTVANFFNVDLVMNEEVLENVKDLIINKLKRKSLNTLNQQQAYIPSNSIALMNKVGTAPGIWIEDKGKIIVLLPGIPFEMKYLMQQEVLPKLKERYTSLNIYRKKLIVLNIPESELAERLENWENNLPNTVQVAYLPTSAVVKIRITVSNTSKEKAEKLLEENTTILQQLLGNHLISVDGEDLPSIIKSLLVKRKLSLTTAESFTSGKIASMLTSVSGSSEYFIGSIVSYATETKKKVLGISSQLIEKHTVVSEEVATSMATQAQKLMQADVAIATTGVAGPTTDDFNNQVGLAYIAIAIQEKVYTKKFYYPLLDRNEFSQLLSRKALEMFFLRLTQ